jgi:MFS family permease
MDSAAADPRPANSRAIDQAPERSEVAPAALPAVRPLADGLRRYALGLLFLIYVLNFVDRQIVNILAEKIRNEFHLRDWQIGAMTGLSFALFYSVLGVPVARLADRGDRPWIIGAAVILWSGFTAICGLARTFAQFALARVGVGVGEAGCTPPAHSLISDYVAKERRASALAFYAMGGPVGSLVGIITGGLVADLWGWRAAFTIVAAPGVLVGLVGFLTLPEPRRALGPRDRRPPRAALSEMLGELASSRTYWLFAAGTVMMALVSYGQGAFLASFFLRNHAADLARHAARFGFGAMGFLGLSIGLITGLAGIAGALTGGFLADRLSARTPKGYATLAAAAAFFTVPPYLGAMLAPSYIAALALLFPAYFAFNLSLGAMYAVPQSVVQPHNRAMATALLFFMTNFIGLGAGPVVVGALSDLLQSGASLSPGEAIRWVQIADTLLGLLAAALYWRARRYIEADVVS